MTEKKGQKSGGGAVKIWVSFSNERKTVILSLQCDVMEQN